MFFFDLNFEINFFDLGFFLITAITIILTSIIIYLRIILFRITLIIFDDRKVYEGLWERQYGKHSCSTILSGGDVSPTANFLVSQ